MKTLGKIGLTITFLVYKVNCVHLACIIKMEINKDLCSWIFHCPTFQVQYSFVLKRIQINLNILIHNFIWFEYIGRSCKSNIKISNYKPYLVTDPLLLAEMLLYLRRTRVSPFIAPTKQTKARAEIIKGQN